MASAHEPVRQILTASHDETWGAADPDRCQRSGRPAAVAAGATRVGGPWPGPPRRASTARESTRPGRAKRRRRGHRPQHLPLVAQRVDVRDRLTTIGQHRDVDRLPARSCTGRKERHAVAFDSSLVNPLRSASNLTAMLPACAMTPVPSADTETPTTTSDASPVKCLSRWVT